VGHRCGPGGIRRHCRGHDLSRRAYAGAVPAGGTDILADGSQVSRPNRIGRVDLPGWLPARVLGGRIIVCGRVSANERTFLPIRVHVRVAERLRVAAPHPQPQSLPVSICVALAFRVAFGIGLAICVAVRIALAVRVALAFHVAIGVDESVPVFFHADEPASIRSDIRVTVAAEWQALSGVFTGFMASRKVSIGIV